MVVVVAAAVAVKINLMCTCVKMLPKKVLILKIEFYVTTCQLQGSCLMNFIGMFVLVQSK